MSNYSLYCRRWAVVGASNLVFATIGILVHLIVAWDSEQEYAQKCADCYDVTNWTVGTVIALLIGMLVQSIVLFLVAVDYNFNHFVQRYLLSPILLPMMIDIYAQYIKWGISGQYWIETSLQFYAFFLGSIGAVLVAISFAVTIFFALFGCCELIKTIVCSCANMMRLNCAKLCELFYTNNNPNDIAGIGNRSGLTLFHLSENPEGETECSICKGEFGTDGIPLAQLLCNHIFHCFCIQKWLDANNTCPLCRVQVYITA